MLRTMKKEVQSTFFFNSVLLEIMLQFVMFVLLWLNHRKTETAIENHTH